MATTGLFKLRYVPQNFRDLAETDLGKALWEFLKQHDNILRMETATLLERAAVEPLATGLVAEFGDEMQDERVKQMIGHMVKQIMAELGYEIDRSALRITRPSLFTSATTYRPAGARDRSMRITREQREAWVKNTKNSPFNRWLNRQVRDENENLDLEKLYSVAASYGVAKRFDHLNPGQQRMNVGVLLRREVDPKEYEHLDDGMDG